MKRFLALLCSAVLVCLTVSCDTKEEQERTKRYLKQAKENAIEYVMEKYGVEAKVMDAEIERIEGLFGSDPGSDAYISMRYDDKIFTVYIAGDEETTDGKDDYQQEEIEAAVLEDIKDSVSGTPDKAVVYNQYNIDRRYLMCDEYFDGDNLSDIFDEYGTCVIAEYTDGTDLSAVTSANLPDYISEADRCTFVSYNTKDAYEKLGEERYSEFPDANGNGIYKLGAYIDTAYTLMYNKENSYTINKGKVGELSYAVSRGSDPDAVIIEKTTPDSPSKWDGKGKGIVDGRFVSDAYSVTYTGAELDGDVYVYFPKSEVSYNEEKAPVIAESNKYQGERRYNISTSVYETGDYYTVKIWSVNHSESEDYYFALITS